jgi:hypothetical protein
MSRWFDQQEGAPRDVRRFERFWFLAIFVSATVAIDMYDYTVMIIGPYLALLSNVAFFGASLLLVIYASRRRSNLARLLTIPFLILILFYDLAHLGAMVSSESLYLLVGTLCRLGLIVVAIRLLFTPSSRAWFAGRSLASAADYDD